MPDFSGIFRFDDEQADLSAKRNRMAWGRMVMIIGLLLACAAVIGVLMVDMYVAPWALNYLGALSKTTSQSTHAEVIKEIDHSLARIPMLLAIGLFVVFVPTTFAFWLVSRLFACLNGRNTDRATAAYFFGLRAAAACDSLKAGRRGCSFPPTGRLAPLVVYTGRS